MPAWGRDLLKIIGTRTFDGSGGNGAVGASVFFTVTGEVWIAGIVPFCVANLGEAAPTATLTAGVVGSTALFSPNPTGGATDLDTGEFWFDATPTTQLAVPAAHKDIAISTNVIVQVAAQNVNSGQLRFTLLWMALSADANVVLASGVS